MRPDVVLFHLSMIRSGEVGLGRELLVEGIWKFRSFQKDRSNEYSWLTMEVQIIAEWTVLLRFGCPGSF